MQPTFADLVNSSDDGEAEEVTFETLVNQAEPEPEDSSYVKFVQDAAMRLSDYQKTGLKGFAEGLGRLGRMMGPLEDYSGKGTEEMLEEQTEALDELLPTETDDFGQRTLRRGLREAPSMLSFPGAQTANMLARVGIASFLGQGLEDLGAPESVQRAAEITAYLGPDLTKKLLTSGPKGNIVKIGKELGLTENQIAPLMQSEFKQKWLSKLSNKRGRTQKALKDTKKGLGEAYDSLSAKPGAKTALSQEASADLIKNLGLEGMDIPSAARKTIARDMMEFVSGPITPKKIFNLNKAINKAMGANNKELVVLKRTLANSLEKVSPELANEFRNVNYLYSRYSDIAERLKPTLVSDLITAGQALGLGGSIVMGNPAGVSAFLVSRGAKLSARELLLNPRLQQLSSKFVKALNDNKYSVAANIYRDINDFLVEKDPKLKKDIKNITAKEFEDLFTPKKESKQ